MTGRDECSWQTEAETVFQLVSAIRQSGRSGRVITPTDCRTLATGGLHVLKFQREYREAADVEK